MTLEEFTKEANRNGFCRVNEFDNIFAFMNFCYRSKITPENSITYVKEDGSGCYLGY